MSNVWYSYNSGGRKTLDVVEEPTFFQVSNNYPVQESSCFGRNFGFKHINDKSHSFGISLGHRGGFLSEINHDSNNRQINNHEEGYLFKRSEPLECHRTDYSNSTDFVADPVFSWPPRHYPLDYSKKLIPPTRTKSDTFVNITENNNLDRVTSMDICENDSTSLIYQKQNSWSLPDNAVSSKYRENLNKKFRNRCVISRIDGTECEGAHIIPKKICDQFNLKFKYHDANGLLLNRNLHTSFDNFIWTFDVYDIKVEQTNPNHVYLSTIAIPNKKNYSICQYRFEQDGTTLRFYKIPVESLPYLYIHYNIFFEKNYKISNNNVEYENQLYQNLLQTEFFWQTMFDPYSFVTKVKTLQNQQKKEARIILDKTFNRTSLPIYLILWNFHPYGSCSWEYETNLDKQLVLDFEILQESKIDPNYV